MNKSNEEAGTKSGSSINGRAVTYAVLPSPVFAEGTGHFGPTLSTKSPGTKILKMTIDEPWLLVDVKGTQSGTVVTVPIPVTSLSHTLLGK